MHETSVQILGFGLWEYSVVFQDVAREVSEDVLFSLVMKLY